MPLKPVFDEGIRKVTLLKDSQAEFVSLVKNGANQSAFRVMKTDDPEMKNKKQGGSSMGVMAVQSLLLPKDKSLEDLAQKDNLGWLADAKTDAVKESSGYVKYVQMPVEKFEENSFGMLKLDDSGAWAVVGKVKKEEQGSDDLLSVGKKEMENTKFATSVLQETVSSETIVIDKSLGEAIMQEIWNMEDVIYSTLRQENLDPAVRKDTVDASINAFHAFMMMALEEVGVKSVDVSKMKDMTRFADKNDKQGEDDMSLFTTKEEFETAVKELMKDIPTNESIAEEVRKAVAELQPAQPEKQEGDQTEKTDTAEKQNSSDPTAELAKKLDDALAKISELEEQVSAEPAASKQEGDEAVGDNGSHANKSDNVWSGLLLK